MKTIDVRIGCSDQFQVFVHDVLLAVEKEYPVTAQITVTELPPPGEVAGSIPVRPSNNGGQRYD